MAPLAVSLPPFGPARLLSEWGLAPVPFVLTVWVAGWYVAGVLALRRRGVRWPVGRTAAFVGMERSALHRKLKFLGVQSDERLRRARS